MKNHRFPIAMVSPDPVRIDQVRVALAVHPQWGVELVYGTCDGPTMLQNLHKYDPTAFLVDLSIGDAEAARLVEHLQQAGYSQFLFLEANPAAEDWPGEVIQTGAPLASVLAAAARMRPLRQAPAEPAAAAGATQTVASLIAVHSPKGGTGKTFLTCALASQYADRGLRTLVVDLGLYGGIAPALGLARPERGLGAILEAWAAADLSPDLPAMGELLRANITTYPIGKQHVDLLLAGPPLKMAGITIEQAEVLFRWLRQAPYDLILVDTSPEIAERTTVALHHADHTLLLLTPEFAAVAPIIAMGDLLKNFHTTGRFHGVLNRCRTSPSVTDLEQAVGCPVVAQIPEVDRPWQHAVGRSLRFDYSTLGLAVKRLAQQFRPIYSVLEIPARKRR